MYCMLTVVWLFALLFTADGNGIYRTKVGLVVWGQVIELYQQQNVWL